MQMDQVTQQNAALVEESSAAAESLKGQAQQLVQAVAVFKLKAGETLAAVAAPSYVADERRSPNRAKNVTRPPFGTKVKAASVAVDKATAPAAPARTGTDDWASF